MDKYVHLFEEDAWWIVTDKALDLLFGTFPRNCRIEAVYLKGIALNDLYATQLRRKRKDACVLFKLAKMICDLNIDDMLTQRLPDLVDKIASLKPGGKKCGYVFASKYCHFHAPNDYPICENTNVEPLVYAYQKSDGQKVKHADLKENYPKYKQAVEAVRSRYGLIDVNFRQFDKFLLGYGKEWEAIRPRRKRIEEKAR